MVLTTLASAAAVTMLPAAAHAGVTANVTATSVSVSAVCSGSPGATFTVTGPNGATFTVNTPNSDTSGFATAGQARGTYMFTGTCANGTNAGSGSFVIAPTGGPMGGDGGKPDNTGFLTAGFLLLSAAACGGILLRRSGPIRRKGTATRATR